MLNVYEIFYSIQGEGFFTGVPSVFVRLNGCNLKCRYCDTAYAQGKEVIKKMSVVQIFDETYRHGCKNICITGGEPLTQEKELEKLVRKLIDDGQLYNLVPFIEIETNGSIEPPKWWNDVDSWSIDVKGPSSGQNGSFKRGWSEVARDLDQFKFVVSTDEDFSEIDKFIKEYKWLMKNVLVSPQIGKTEDIKMNGVKVAEYCKDRKVRMSLQIHKVLYDFKQRGV